MKIFNFLSTLFRNKSRKSAICFGIKPVRYNTTGWNFKKVNKIIDVMIQCTHVQKNAVNFDAIFFFLAYDSYGVV